MGRKVTLSKYVDKKRTTNASTKCNKEKEATAIGDESDESISTIYKIRTINRMTDRNKYLTAEVKVNGNEKELIDTG